MQDETDQIDDDVTPAVPDVPPTTSESEATADEALVSIADSLDQGPESVPESEEAPEPAEDPIQEAPEPAEDSTEEAPGSDAADDEPEPEAEPDVSEVEPAPDAADAEPEPVDDAMPMEAAQVLDVIPEKLRSPVPWWPFWSLTAAWAAVCAAAAYVLTRDPVVPSLRQDAYTYVVAAGLALTLLGPVLSIVVWAVSRGAVAEDRRTGMFVSALLRGAVITFVGVLAWTGTLIVVDALRLGMIRF